jgi:hypothetical protein
MGYQLKLAELISIGYIHGLPGNITVALSGFKQVLPFLPLNAGDPA